MLGIGQLKPLFKSKPWVVCQRVQRCLNYSKLSSYLLLSSKISGHYLVYKSSHFLQFSKSRIMFFSSKVDHLISEWVSECHFRYKSPSQQKWVYCSLVCNGHCCMCVLLQSLNWCREELVYKCRFCLHSKKPHVIWSTKFVQKGKLQSSIVQHLYLAITWTQ